MQPRYTMTHRLRRAVRASGLSQNLLARTCGIPALALIKFLRGDRFMMVNADRALVLADLVGVPRDAALNEVTHD
jgi:transcriptional regulator with XRE-family HTH domain